MPVTDAANGQLVGGRYRLGPHVGSGGMGTVWRAHDELLHRDVAVKDVPIPQGLPAPEAARLRERYLREARAAARLRHAGVVGVYDVLPETERVWIVMEYVKARNLAEILRDEGPIPPDRVAGLGLQILDALDHAHRAGVLHRDVKPANVLVCTDQSEHTERAVLTDFGVASVTGDSSLTRTGHLVGSPAYLSPERLTGGTVGPPSDLWSLGCTLFAAIEGKPPFARDEQFAVITAITLEPVPSAARAGNLAPVLAGLLDKDPEHRWDAVRTRAALKRVAEGDPVDQLSATSWGTPPVNSEGPTWWMPAEPQSGPPAPAPISGGQGVRYSAPGDWTRTGTPPGSASGNPVSGTPVSGYSVSGYSVSGTPSGGTPVPGPPSGPPAGWQGSGSGGGGGSAGYSQVLAFGNQEPKRRGNRLWFWLLAAVVVIALAAAAGVFARRSGLLGDDAAASPTIGATSATSATSSSASPSTGQAYAGSQYSLTYPSKWNKYCLADLAQMKLQGQSACYFDELAPSDHTLTSKVLRSRASVLVIVGTDEGTAQQQLANTAQKAVDQGAVPGYKQVTLTDYQYGSQAGAVLEYTYVGATTKVLQRVRIFRFIRGGTFYEVSLRSPETEYRSGLSGFEQIASTIKPL